MKNFGKLDQKSFNYKGIERDLREKSDLGDAWSVLKK